MELDRPSGTLDDRVIDPIPSDFLGETRESSTLDDDIARTAHSHHDDQHDDQSHGGSSSTTSASGGSHAPSIPREEGGRNSRRKTNYDCALHHKEEGNACYRAGEYHAAIRHYKMSLHYLKRAEPAHDAETLSRTLRLPCYLNLSACDIALEDFASARRHAAKVLKHDPDNPKALYRSGTAKMHAAHDLEGAARDLLAARRLAPHDPNVHAALTKVMRNLEVAAGREKTAARMWMDEVGG